MPSASLETVQLHVWLERWEGGDLSARDELLRSVGERLERLARMMLTGYPRLRRWVDTCDVLQSSVLRLLRALNDVKPASTRDFFRLAAEQMRRELLDLVRHYYGPQGAGAHEANDNGHEESPGPIDDDLEKWTAFHTAVETLPAEEREVVGLIFYHGWKQAAVAELMQINERTVRRRWEAALIKLHQFLREPECGPR
jgi:RNA polymerase sigma-70 factor (ECF subfamily)